MDINFEGLEELIQEIDRMEGATNELKDEALIAGGDVLLERMKAEVYANGLERRTGEAEASLTRTEPSNDELFVGTQGGKKQPGFYLYMHEFGYFNVRAGRFMAPIPFASIAFDRAKNDILDAQIKVLRRGLGM